MSHNAPHVGHVPRKQTRPRAAWSKRGGKESP